MGIAANVGDVAITTFETWCPDSVVGFVPSPNISSEYLYFLLLGLRSQVNETSTENTQENTNIERLGDLRVALPDRDTQAQILKNLDSVSDLSHALVRKLGDQIYLLREHRQAVITAAVTGRMMVPGVAA